MGAAALLAEHWVSVAVIAAVLLGVCLGAPPAAGASCI